MRFKLPPEKLARLESFISSDIAKSRSSIAYSNYWRFHAEQMSVSIETSGIQVDGKSGYYIPESYASRLIATLLKPVSIPRKIGRRIASLLTIPRMWTIEEGMNYALANDNDLDKLRNAPELVNKPSEQYLSEVKSFKELKLFHRRRLRFPFSDRVAIAHYYTHLMSKYLSFAVQRHCFLEIGGGSGNLCAVMVSAFRPKVYIHIDLPESIVNCYSFIANTFPNAKLLLPDEIGKSSESLKFLGDLGISQTPSDETFFIFLTPWQIQYLPDHFVDLAINTYSFQEMTRAQIDEYYELIYRTCKVDGRFFCANRINKYPSDGNDAKSLTFDMARVNRFYDYPWRRRDKRLIDEVDELHLRIQSSPIGIRYSAISSN